MAHSQGHCILLHYLKLHNKSFPNNVFSDIIGLKIFVKMFIKSYNQTGIILSSYFGMKNGVLSHGLSAHRSRSRTGHSAGVSDPSLRRLPVLFIRPVEHIFHLSDLVLTHSRHIHIPPEREQMIKKEKERKREREKSSQSV